MKKRSSKKTVTKKHAAPVSKTIKKHVTAIGKHADALKKIAHKSR